MLSKQLTLILINKLKITAVKIIYFYSFIDSCIVTMKFKNVIKIIYNWKLKHRYLTIEFRKMFSHCFRLRIPIHSVIFNLQARHMGENLIAAMNPGLKEKFMELRNVNSALMHDLDIVQQEIDNLDTKRQALEDELSLSKVN